jgi:glutamine phosphoribosylpyrophosphate amidotransferase
MCEIYVTAGKFEERFLRSLPHIGEMGRGFALIYPNEVVLLRDLDAEAITDEYLRSSKPVASILHRRIPTHGKISVDNTQPFSDGKRVLAHNGTLNEGYWLLRAMYPDLREASDSRLLWKFIKDMPWEQALELLQLLKALGNRFVLADVRQRQIALIGGWMWDERRQVWDRWSWGRKLPGYEYVLLDYSGGTLKVLQKESADPKFTGKGGYSWW